MFALRTVPRPLIQALGGLLLGLGLVLSLAAPASAQAGRNAEAEAFVQRNANLALGALGSANAANRAREFDRLMREFADMPRVGITVLGRCGTTVNANPALRQEWLAAFSDYAVAVYEESLDRYRGTTLEVTGSVERQPGRDVVVRSRMAPRGQTRPLPLEWRVLQTSSGWRVVDVSLLLDGNQLWLGQSQARDFAAQLTPRCDNVSQLGQQLRAQATQMRARVRGR